MNVILPKKCFIFVEENKNDIMKTVSTLDGMYFSSQRASGNTTRIINFAIELLFRGETIKVEDHHENGTNAMANRMLADRIMGRLVSEHFNDDKSKVDFNRMTMIMKLK